MRSKSGDTRLTTELHVNDFTDIEKVEQLTGYKFVKDEYLEVTVSAYPVPGSPGSYWEPGEPPHCEDMYIWYDKKSQLKQDLNIKTWVDLTDYICKKSIEKLENEILSIVSQDEEDYYNSEE